MEIFLFIIIVNLFILYYYSFIFKHEAITKNSNVEYKISEHVGGNEKINEKKAEKRLIILAAMFRSGSSFLGSLFDQNPNLLYYFEPITIFSDHSDSMKYKLKMLQGNKFIIFCK